MVRICTLLVLFSGMAISGFSQNITVKGTVADEGDQTAVSGATITITSLHQGVQQHTVTNSAGYFEIKGLANDSFSVLISSVNYDSYQKLSAAKQPVTNLGILHISKQGKTLQTVVVEAKEAPTQQKGDTIQYNASQFKVNPDATTEDLIKKMPGITVDKSGTVTAQGDQVKKVTLDGKDFFGDDATAALRNLPAEVVDKIQVFDKLSDQAAFTGFDDGNSVKAINIVTKGNMRNGQFGRLYAGYGTDGRYSLGGNESFFKGNRRISLVGMFNNINQQNFSSQDLLGVSSSGGGGNRGGGRGGGGGQFGGNGGSNFLVGQQSGISATNSFGFNYSDMWGKKLQVTGSYFFNNSTTNNDQLSNIQYFTNHQNTSDSTLSNTKNWNNRMNFRFEYKIDSFNSITMTPVLSFQKNNAYTNDRSHTDSAGLAPVNRSLSNNTSDLNGYNISNSILFRHSFHKRGRTISVNLTTAFSNKTGNVYQQSDNIYYKGNFNLNDSLQQYNDQLTKGHQLSANIVYTEPVGKTGQLQLNYSPGVSVSNADQEVFQYDHSLDKYSRFDTSLSNKFDNTTTTQSAGITYRKGNRDNMLAVGLAYQYTGLHSDQKFPMMTTVNESYNYILPNLMWRKKINIRSNIRIMYRANVNTPSISQLQNVYNNTNPLYITTGNPELKAQWGNTLSARYSYTNTAKGTSMFANIFLQQNSNYITNATYSAFRDSALTPTVVLHKGSQLTKPVNLDGYWSLRSFFTYGMPVKLIKSNINLNAGFTWSTTPGMINYVSSLSNNYNYNGGIVVASNINEYIDFNLSYSVSYNVIRNTIQPTLNNNYVTYSPAATLNLLSKKGWFISNDVSNQTYSGLTAGITQSYWLWNAAIGKKFLKKQAAELKLSVFDLLKQNNSITRTSTVGYVEDDQSQVLQQYFMLTFSYKLKSFGKANVNAGGQNRERRMREGDYPSF